MYDLTVDGDPEFFVNGILVHNCACLTYLVRKVEQYTNLRPTPPQHVLNDFPAGAQVIARLPWNPKTDAEKALEQAQAFAHGTQERGRLKIFRGGRDGQR